MKIGLEEFKKEVSLKLHYDHVTGVFVWRKGATNAGKVATHTCKGDKGRLFIRLGSARKAAARIAHLIMYGKMPSRVVHLNGELSDLRAVNLSAAEPWQSNRSLRLQKVNTTGFTGVYLTSTRGRFEAKITVAGKAHCLGRFDCPEDAARAYDAAATARLGEFAKTNEAAGRLG